MAELAINHRAVSLAFLRSTGMVPVRVRPGQKDPFPEWDPRRAALEDHGATLRHIEDSPDLNLGALFCGRWLDIDVDSYDPNLVAALDYFLPRTPYVWGRDSKPRSHRAYALHQDFDRATWGNLLRYFKSGLKNTLGNDLSVELRGGKAEAGLFSVLPGSRHPSGELVEWAEDIDPSVSSAYVPIPKVVDGVRLAIAATIILGCWTEGQRNDVSLALAGLCWRIRAASLAAYQVDDESEVGEDQFLMTEDRTDALFKGVMTLAGDDENDIRSRVLNLKNTWRKLDTDATAKISGGKILAELIGEGGDNVVKALYRLLSDSDGAEAIEALAEQFVMWYGQGVIIDTQMVNQGRANPWMHREQASNSLGGRKIEIAGNKIPIVNILFGSTIIQRVGGLTFDPSSPDRLVIGDYGVMVNEWKGFKQEPCTQTVTEEEVEPFKDYVLNILADGDEKRALWTFAWLADALQMPANKPGTALVLVGAQGAGKSFLGECVMGPIIGNSHYAQTNSIAELTGKFNTVIDNKVFLQCDEAVHSYQKDVASRLKSIITDKTITIEPKNINSFKKPNHLRFLFTSNDESAAIFIDPSPYERRFTVLKVSSSRASDLEYWTTMRTWTEANLAKIMRWLLDYQYARSLVIRPIDSEAKRDIQRVGVDPEVSWIIAGLARGFPISKRTQEHWFQAFLDKSITDHDKKNDVLRRDEWPDTVSISTLEQDLRSFVREHGKTVWSGSALTSIRRVMPVGSVEQKCQTSLQYIDGRSGQVTKDRVRLYHFPSRQAIFAHLREKYGEMVDRLLQDAQNEPPLDEAPAEDDKGEY